MPNGDLPPGAAQTVWCVSIWSIMDNCWYILSRHEQAEPAYALMTQLASIIIEPVCVFHAIDDVESAEALAEQLPDKAGWSARTIDFWKRLSLSHFVNKYFH